MKKIGEIVSKYYKTIVVVCLILLVPAFIGIHKTRINYDILVYLPEDIETIRGEKILTDDFKMGSYAIVIINNMHDKDILLLENKIRNVDGVGNVMSVDDITGTSIPIEYIPDKIKNKVSKNGSKLVFITFNDSTSSDKTLDAVENIRQMVNKSSEVGGMSTMVLDTKELFNSEMTLYVVIAVIFCIIVLLVSLDSYIVPFILILNIGIAILYNMGTNIFLGNISYITKAISSVLQLGVTTDFSIFLYHKYEKAKCKYNGSQEAMSVAINDTLVSVLGSSLTTIAGFLALCTMNLKLGMDIGIVMAKGVVFGLICVVTIFPALLLLLDKYIDKTKHRVIIPKFNRVKRFVMDHYRIIFAIFLLLLFPAFKAQTKTSVYYKLDESIPDNYGYSKATRKLKDDYGIVSQDIILVSRNLSSADINMMVEQLEQVPGINLVLSPSSMVKYGIDDSILSSDIRNIYESDKYEMILINSDYDIASNELNDQISKVKHIVKKYDSKAIIAGEGPLMKDLIETTDQDFKNVNYTSIIVIFILMLLVLKSISLPVLLVSAIELAIFINMGIPYFEGIKIPFIASVVIGTIQLGATIDYAILMTTSYLDNRKRGIDKRQSVQSALDNAVPSIFVSGMCFFAATVGVALISKIDLIGSLCTLISRGAIISMLIVIFVVPSILLIFDRIIVNTTLGFKKGRFKMKKKMAVLVSIMFLLIMPVNALTKDETVYTKLGGSGKVKQTSVVNHLINDENLNKIIDTSNLKRIENVNGNEKYKKKDKNIIWSANKKDIYYKGNSNKTLPLNVKISYKLNNRDIKLSKLLGKKGHVDINIKYTNKDKQGNLYTPFVVAVTTVLDGKDVSNIRVINGKFISNGQNYIVAGLALPGLYENLNILSLKNTDAITISYDTTSFSLSSIYSVATPKVVDEFDLSKLDDLDNIYGSIDQLTNGSKKLVEGSQKINEGAIKIDEGVTSSIDKLKNNDETIDRELLESIQNQAKEKSRLSVEDQSDNIMSKAEQGVIDMEEQTHQIKQASDSGIENNADLISALKLGAHYKMQQTEQGKQAYDACMAGMDDYCGYVIQAEDEAINQMKHVMYESALNLAKQTASQIAYQTALQVSQDTAYNVSGSVASNVAHAVKTTILSNVTTSLEQLKKGLDSLVIGTNELSSGMSKFDNQGINKISSIVDNDIKPNIDKVKQLKSLAHNYNAFSGSHNSMDTNTKFIMIVDGKRANNKNKIIHEDKATKESMLDRIKKLFK